MGDNVHYINDKAFLRYAKQAAKLRLKDSLKYQRLHIDTA